MSHADDPIVVPGVPLTLTPSLSIVVVRAGPPAPTFPDLDPSVDLTGLVDAYTTTVAAVALHDEQVAALKTHGFEV